VAEGGVPRHPLALERLSEAGAFSAMPTMGGPTDRRGTRNVPDRLLRTQAAGRD
jgi:hypothetical protein